MRAPDVIVGGIAVLLGAAIGYVDSRPTWDDTGVTVAVILFSCAALAFARPRAWWFIALAIGAPVLVLEHFTLANWAPAMAVAVSGLGVGVGVMARLLVRAAGAPGAS